MTRSKSTPGPKPRGRAALHIDDAPKMPRGLTPAAKKIWRDLAPALVDAGLLSAVDSGPFGLYCQSLAFAFDAAGQLAADGLTTKDRAHGGELRKHAAWQIFAQANATVASWAAHFGTTAKARQALPVEENAGAGLEDYMRREVERRKRSEEPATVADEW